MAIVMKISGPARALLLLAALLAAGARGDDVTTRECKERGLGERVRQSPVDSRATALYMGMCSLTSIPQHQLSGLPAVTWLSLSENELRELPVFEERVCANMTVLSLNLNRLSGIYKAMTFSACTKLERLYLDDNHIEVIDRFVFTALINLKYLSLHDNMIRYIPDQLLASNGKLKELYLQSNRITHLPPEFASRLKRAAAGLNLFFIYNNPWHCACLIELLADVRRAGMRDYSSGFYGETQSVCNYISMRDYPCHKIREINFIAHGVR